MPGVEGEAVSGRCGTCAGRGELRNTDGTVFQCPDCGGREPAIVADKAARRRKPTGEIVSIAVPAKTWAAVREAAKLNGRKPKDWAIEALANAARQQVLKHRRAKP